MGAETNENATSTDLIYRGKPMTVEPANRSLAGVAELLRTGRSVIAELEPGDATYYNLLLVPCWAPGISGHLGRFGVPSGSAHRFLIVVKVDEEGGGMTFVPTDGQKIGVWDTLHLSSNEWSQELFAWWLSHLITALNEV